MSRKLVLTLLVLLLLASISQPAAELGPDMQSALEMAASSVCNPPLGCDVMGFQRDVLLPGIVHYSARVQVGPDPHDQIRIHRVVRENRPGYPLKNVDRIMLLHGDAKDFTGMFLPALYSPATPHDSGIAIYLAQNRVDVWGMDQGWVLVPPETTDFGFMQDWGMQRSVDDMRTGLALARETRRLMGASDDRFNLLGYSSGGFTGYALLNHEAGLPKQDRHVQAYVNADINYLTMDPDLREVFCTDAVFQRDQYEQGAYGAFVPFQLLGNLGRSDPDGPSEIIPGLTNLQTALFFGAGPIFGTTPAHYLAGVFDADGLPAALQYVSTGAYLDFLESAIVWQPTLFFLDYDEIGCGMDTPFDDNLAQVTVPVYNWGTAGGLGRYGTEMRDYLGTSDFSEHIVSLHPPEDVLLDFAHIDLFIARNAPDLAWAQLLDWLEEHR